MQSKENVAQVTYRDVNYATIRPTPFCVALLYLSPTDFSNPFCRNLDHPSVVRSLPAFAESTAGTRMERASSCRNLPLITDFRRRFERVRLPSTRRRILVIDCVELRLQLLAWHW